jgi:hypothetical protein
MNTDTGDNTASTETDQFRATLRLEGLIIGELLNDDLVKEASKLIESLAAGAIRMISLHRGIEDARPK